MKTQFVRIPTIEKDTPIVSCFSRKKDKNSDELLAKFIESYLKHPAGWPHKLFFIKKGFQKHEAEWQKALEPLGDLDYGVLEVPDKHYCFGYQRMLPERWPEQYFRTPAAISAERFPSTRFPKILMLITPETTRLGLRANKLPKLALCENVVCVTMPP